jgi:hypothetical protein
MFGEVTEGSNEGILAARDRTQGGWWLVVSG